MANITSESLPAVLQLPALSPPPGVIPLFDRPYSAPLFFTLTVSLCSILCTICVSIRLCTRLCILKKMGGDDYMSFAAWLGYVAYVALSWWAAKNGAGNHQWNLRLGQLIRLFRIAVILDLVYAPTILLTSVSMLLQYLRIFSPAGHKNYVVYYGAHIVIWVATILSIASIFVEIFTCIPVKRLWNPFVPGHCLDLRPAATAMLALRVSWEFAILIMPFRIIWKLQTGFRKKGTVFLIFGAGFFVCTACILRMVDTIRFWQNKDYTYGLAILGVYSHIEISLGIMCGCFTTFPKFFGYLHSKTDLRSDRKPKKPVSDVSRKSLSWRIPTRWHYPTSRLTWNMNYSQFDESGDDMSRMPLDAIGEEASSTTDNGDERILEEGSGGLNPPGVAPKTRWGPGDKHSGEL